MWKILFHRLGFNCNSSSTTVLFDNLGKKEPKYPFFQFSSLIKDLVIKHFLKEDADSHFLEKFLLPEIKREEATHDDMDFNLPLGFSGNINVPFVEWALKQDIVAYSGDRDHLYELETFGRIGLERSILNIIFNMEKPVVKVFPSMMVFFDKRTGELLWIVNDTVTDKEQKCPTPNLVDLKITDFCSFGCKFCYQGSTLDGNSGEIEFIKKLSYLFEDLEVFEVAIGGGDPTFHPDLLKILQLLKEGGCTPSFTTRNKQFVFANYKKLAQTVGAVAFSTERISPLVTLIEGLEALKNNYGGYDYEEHKPLKLDVHIHLIPAIIPKKEFSTILEYCGGRRITTTLLGYKTTGRANKEIKRCEYDIAKIVEKNLRYEAVCQVDTTFVDQYPQYFTNTPAEYWKMREGQASVYVDVVNKKIGKNSFGAEMFPLDEKDLKNSFLNHYVSF